MSPYVRTVRTASGARAVQIVYSSRRGSRRIEHIGSAHDDAQLEALKAVAAQRLNAGQLSFDLGDLGVTGGGGPDSSVWGGGGLVVPITSSRMGVLLGVLPTDVVCAVDGWFASDAGVGSVVIVVVEPVEVGCVVFLGLGEFFFP